jgi:hypothetical protein
MKTLIAGLATAALLLLIPALAPAQPTAADRTLGPDRDQAFTAYVDFITSVHAVSRDGAARIGVPWETALENGQRRFREARTVEDVYYALLSVQRTLRDGHGRFARNELPVTFGPAVVLDFDVVVRYAAPSGGAHEYVVARSGEPSLPPGSTITGCDGLDMAAFEARMLEWYDRHTPEGLREFAARRLSYRKPQSMPCPRPGEAAAITYRDADGRSRTATLAWRAASVGIGTDPDVNGSSEASATPPGQREPLRLDAEYQGFPLEKSGLFFEIYGTRSAGTKILRYVSFNYESESDFPPEIAAIGEHLRAAGTKRVLVDIRENGGGAFEPALVGVFTTQPFRIMMKSFYYGARIKAHPEAMKLDKKLDLWTDDEARLLQEDLAAHPSATWSRPIPFFCRTAACADDEAAFQFDGSPGYETVVLCGPATFSSGDMLVTIMKDNGIAKLAGMPSGAGDAPYRWRLDYPLADGTKVSLRLTTAVSYRPNSNGVIIEGNPPIVDFPVYPTRANAGAFLDSVLAAVGWE